MGKEPIAAFRIGQVGYWERGGMGRRRITVARGDGGVVMFVLNITTLCGWSAK